MKESLVIVICGPTLTNKLSYALKLNEYLFGKYRLDSEIVNIDSKKIYSEFKVSQSLPNTNLIQRAKLHLFGEIKASREINLNEFDFLVKERIEEIISHKKIPILVGGSPLHLTAIISNWSNTTLTSKLIFKIFLLDYSTGEIFKNRVVNHVDTMIKNGLIEEFNMLYKLAQEKKIDINILNKTIGYKEASQLLQDTGKIATNNLRKLLIKNIYEFAYKQKVSFRKIQSKIKVNNMNDLKSSVDEILDKHLTPQPANSVI